MSRRGREGGIPVRLRSDSFAVRRGPTIDQHARKGEFLQRVREEEQVAGKAGPGEEQARQALARDGQQGSGAKADE